jgi:hypothetical protein
MSNLNKIQISDELEIVGAKIKFYTSLARREQFNDGTRTPMCDADDVVSISFEKLASKLYSGKLPLAQSVKHARARFTLIVQGYLRDLRKKRDRVYSASAIVELHSVDHTIAKELLEKICDRLRPTDALQLQRCADGENLNASTLTKIQMHRLRNKVRKQLQA